MLQQPVWSRMPGTFWWELAWHLQGTPPPGSDQNHGPGRDLCGTSEANLFILWVLPLHVVEHVHMKMMLAGNDAGL